MKPDKFGIKVWMLADADNYYVTRFQVYLEKKSHEQWIVSAQGFGVLWRLDTRRTLFRQSLSFFLWQFLYFSGTDARFRVKRHVGGGTIRTNRRDFPVDLKWQKLVVGEIRTHQSRNLLAMMWKDKRVVSLLSTNTPPEPEIHAVQQVVWGRRKWVVPAEAMRKPEVVPIYNHGMNGVDVNNQCQSYYPPGSVSRKWWRYLLWFFFNLSMV